MNTNFDSINGYQFEHDIVFFIRDELKINNDELLLYCQNNPVLLFSETSKYLVNNNQYYIDQNLVDDKNHILDIRKSIFENRKNNFNIKKIVSSPLLRARETSSIINSVLNVEIEYSTYITEWQGPINWVGLTFNEISKTKNFKIKK